MKSKPYKRGKKLFRYDFDNGMVEYICKADEEMLKDNEEWVAKYGKPLWDVDADGYCIVDAVGLRAENWKDKESRDCYLDTWLDDMREEFAYEMALFEKYEAPLYREVANG